MHKVSVLHYHHDLCGTMFILSSLCLYMLYPGKSVVVNTLEQ